MLKIQNIKLPLNYKEQDIRKACEKALRRKDFTGVKILRRAIDARKQERIHYNISAGVTGYSEAEEKKIVHKINNNNIMLTTGTIYHFPYKNPASIPHAESCPETLSDETAKMTAAQIEDRPVIIGTGPAGYFAGLMLAKAGFRPILIERGKPVEERKADVDALWSEGKLDQNSNVSFGEGGAGTFSDGKLYTGNKDKDGTQAFVLETFHRFGAAEEITYDAKPHIGTDVLYRIMQNMRQEITDFGGEIRFSEQLVNIEHIEGSADTTGTPSDLSKNRIYLKDPKEKNHCCQYKLTIKKLCKQNGYEVYFLTTSAVILAIGHSARDTFKMLKTAGLTMEKKPFAIGLRIEHPRSLIDRARYGEAAAKNLPAADYKLVYHTTEGRAVFSFCMCPGGYVVNASTEEEGIVVNGMSYSGRNGENSNSAIVVNVLPEDIPGEDPLSGIEYQRGVEHEMFRIGRGSIPIQRWEDFRENRITEKPGAVTPQIKGNTQSANLRDALPHIISRAIAEAIPALAKKLPGFDLPDAVLSGIESRTSSPVRIIRGEDLSAEHFSGIYPCGEGAGYAGGIMSAAVDGIHVAEAVAAKYAGI